VEIPAAARYSRPSCVTSHRVGGGIHSIVAAGLPNLWGPPACFLAHSDTNCGPKQWPCYVLCMLVTGLTVSLHSPAGSRLFSTIRTGGFSLYLNNGLGSPARRTRVPRQAIRVEAIRVQLHIHTSCLPTGQAQYRRVLLRVVVKRCKTPHYHPRRQAREAGCKTREMREPKTIGNPPPPLHPHFVQPIPVDSCARREETKSKALIIGKQRLSARLW
ncbi:unnamed protein product, partial [Pleuronectes platessa]